MMLLNETMMSAYQIKQELQTLKDINRNCFYSSDYNYSNTQENPLKQFHSLFPQYL